MKLVDKVNARAWLNENDIVIEKNVSQSPVFDAITEIELENGKLSFKIQTFEDFVFACIVKLKIPYAKFPVEFKTDTVFLNKVIYAMPSILNEIVIANPNVGIRLIDNYKRILKLNLIDKKTKKTIKRVLEHNFNL